MHLAAARPEPIPCFMEMSSTNPLFVLPGRPENARRANRRRTVFVVYPRRGPILHQARAGVVRRNESADALVAELVSQVEKAAAAPMLTEGICKSYKSGVTHREGNARVELLAQPSASSAARRAGFSGSVPGGRERSAGRPRSRQRDFLGPSTLVVRYGDKQELIALTRALEGQLTATLHGTDADLAAYADLVWQLEQKRTYKVYKGSNARKRQHRQQWAIVSGEWLGSVQCGEIHHSQFTTH